MPSLEAALVPRVTPSIGARWVDLLGAGDAAVPVAMEQARWDGTRC